MFATRLPRPSAPVTRQANATSSFIQERATFVTEGLRLRARVYCVTPPAVTTQEEAGIPAHGVLLNGGAYQLCRCFVIRGGGTRSGGTIIQEIASLLLTTVRRSKGARLPVF